MWQSFAAIETFDFVMGPRQTSVMSPYKKVKAEKDRTDSRPHIPDPLRSGFTLCGKAIIGPSDSKKVWCARCALETGKLPRQK